MDIWLLRTGCINARSEVQYPELLKRETLEQQDAQGLFQSAESSPYGNRLCHDTHGSAKAGDRPYQEEDRMKKALFYGIFYLYTEQEHEPCRRVLAVGSLSALSVHPSHAGSDAGQGEGGDGRGLEGDMPAPV